MLKIVSLLLLSLSTAHVPSIVIPRSEKSDLEAFVECVEHQVLLDTSGSCLSTLPQVLTTQLPVSVAEIISAVNNQLRKRRLTPQNKPVENGKENESRSLSGTEGAADERSRLPFTPVHEPPSIVVTTRPLSLSLLSNGDLMRIPEGPPIIVVAVAPAKPEKLVVEWRRALEHIDSSWRVTVLPLTYTEVGGVLANELRVLVATSDVWKRWADIRVRELNKDEESLNTEEEVKHTTTPFNHQKLDSHAQYYIAGAGVAAAFGGVIVLLSTSLGTSAAADRKPQAGSSEESIEW